MKLTTCLPFALFLLAATAGAQPQQAEFIHLTPRDGLSDAFVWPILQSQDGYMWFGTDAGLDRYDGYSVERFMHDPSDDGSIREGRVLALIEAPDGTIWAGTSGGLSRMDPGTRQFTSIELDSSIPADSQWVMESWALHRSADGTIWAGTGNGLYAFPEDDPERVRHFRHDPDDPSTIGASRINVVVGGTRGVLWLGSLEDGLTRLDSSTGTATHYRHDPDITDGLSSNRIWDLHFDRAGQLWIATSNAGLCRFVVEQESFHCFRHDPDDPTSLSDDGVQSIYEDEDGRLWLGTDGGGVSILDPDTGTFTALRHDPGNSASLGEDDVHYVYRDRFGTMWFAHHHSGVSRMTPGSVRFETQRAVPEAPQNAPVNLVQDVFEDGNGVLWMATAHGLIRHDPASDEREHFIPFPELAPRGSVAENRNMLSSILQDAQGRLWTGNPAGDLLVFEPLQGTFRAVSTPEGDHWAFPGRWVYPWEVDREGHLWIAAIGRGLWRLNPQTEAITEFHAGIADDGTPLGGIAIPFQDEQGTIWRAGYVGGDTQRPTFQRFDAASGTFELVSLTMPDAQYNRIFMFGDRPGEFWIEGAGGLYRADTGAGEVELFSRREHGAPSNSNGFERDSQGRLWYGSWTGSFGVFDPERGSSVAFFPQDGVQISRFLGSRTLPSGELVFAGFGGYVRFRPEDILSGGTPPEVRVSAMHAAGEPVDFSGEGSSIRLAHDRNTLAFEYVGLHFADPSRNQYRYRLEGFDAGWNRVGTQRSALYPGLPPGKYTFRVQAAGTDGLWTEQEAAVAFQVLPPWWRTWWAYGFYGLMLVGGIVGVDRVQRRRVVQQERERAREQALRHAREIEAAYESLKAAQAQLVQQEKLASLGALTAGIAHEIKNPLNFVNNFGQLNGEMIGELREALGEHPTALIAVDELLSDLQMNTAKIEEHGKRADSIVKSMLQHSRGGTGKRETVNVNDLVEEYVGLAYHGRRAQQPGFNVTIERDLAADAGEIDLVPQDIGRVVLNLVGNAFDAVNDRAAAGDAEDYQPTVRISTRRSRGKIEIRVEDNGPGIPAEVTEKIFEPFFTTKAAGHGTGLGLSLSHEIVTQGHAGTLAVERAPVSGTTFIISLPVSQTSPRI